MTPQPVRERTSTAARRVRLPRARSARASPFGRTFTVEHLGNVVDGAIVKYLNVEIDVMKNIAMRRDQGGEPVWFGCDVGKMMRRDIGVWDAGALRLRESLYDTTFDLDKAGASAVPPDAHDACDALHRRGRRRRLGPPLACREQLGRREGGRKGFYLMNDSWFDEYMFEIAARRSALPARLQEALALEPIVLPPWDPMGALA